jgi:hypothetical protein
MQVLMGTNEKIPDTFMLCSLQRSASSRFATWQATSKQLITTVELCLCFNIRTTVLERILIFESLGALSSLGIKRLIVNGACMKGTEGQYQEFQLGADEADPLGSSFGPQVTELVFSTCTFVPGFWAAVASKFPNVRTLTVKGVNEGVSVREVGRFCRAMRGPLEVYIDAPQLPSVLRKLGCGSVVIHEPEERVGPEALVVDHAHRVHAIKICDE